MNYTVKNFDSYKQRPVVEGDMIVEFGDVIIDLDTETEWQKVNITSTFNDPVVVMGPLSIYSDLASDHPVTTRVKNVTREHFFF